MGSGNIDDHWTGGSLQEAWRLYTIRAGQDVGNPTPHFHTLVRIWVQLCALVTGTPPHPGFRGMGRLA